MAMKKRAVVLSVIIATLIASCAPSVLETPNLKATSSAEPFKILMVQDLSGPLSTLGLAEVQGMKAAASVVNAHGGMLGRQVQVDAVDSQADATKAVSLLVERITKDQIPDMVQGGTSSNETLAMLPIMMEHKIMYFGQNGAADINNPEKYPYAFSMAVPPSVTVQVVTDYCKKMGYKKVGVMQSNSASGQSEMALFETAFKDAGIEFVVQTFEPTAVDMTPQLDALKAAGPDALVSVVAFGRAALTLLQSRQKLGWDIPVVGDAALAAQDLAGPLGMEPLHNVYHAIFKVQQYLPQEKRTPAFNTFLEALKKQGEIKTSLNVYSQAYDELMILNEAAKQANSTEIEKLATALENLRIPDSPQWVTYRHIVFSKENHFNAIPPEEAQVVIPTGPIIEGMFQPANVAEAR
jgi:branched-chain amino acid transport system substrate-binding protein